MKHIVPNPR